jgi:Acyltransferase family
MKVASPTTRRQDIEFLRVISALGIVFYHSGGKANALAYPGLTTFLILSMYLGGAVGAADAETLRRRFKRLLAPWLVWFCFYGLFNFTRSKAIISTENGLAAGILAGPSIHLWYMPFIFICLISLDVVKGILPAPVIAISSGVIAAAIISTTPKWRPITLTIGYPIAQWAQALGAVFIGIFLLYLDSIQKFTGYSLLVLIFLCAALVISYGGVGIPYLIGIFVCSIVHLRRAAKPISINLGFLPECTFGIYLSHIFFISLLKKTGIEQPILLPILTFILSALFVVSLRRAFPSVSKYWS